MNEQRIALNIRRALDRSVDKLPYRVTHRLEAARRRALAAIPQAVASVEQATAAVGNRIALAGGPQESSLWSRVLVAALPLLAVIAGLAAISVWNDFATADETADVEAAMLVDDVPISAYADRGFGVFLKNAEP